MDCDIENHLKHFPNAAIQIVNERIYGIWMVGNFFKRTKDYHGSYPPSYVKRCKTLFPGHKNLLHLFSGMVDKEIGEKTFDINPKLSMDYGNVEELSRYFKPDSFDFVLADPPYNKTNALIYGCAKMPRMHLVMQELHKIVVTGGICIWLCTSPPLYKKTQWSLKGLIGLHTGTNRCFRAVVIMQRLATLE
jgi:hypothetical protein